MPFLQFYIPSIEILDLEIKSLINTGPKRFLLVQEGEKAHMLIKRFAKEKLTFHILKDAQIQTLQDKIKEYEVIILTEDKDLDSLSKQLLSCLNIEKGIVLAPLTDNYFMKRPFFLMTIPKSGTHMLTNMFSHLDLKRNYSHIPIPGKYSTLENYTYHAPCKEFMLREWPEPIGRHPFSRSPAIFMYRNPLDIIVSEFSWYQKPDIAFSHYLKTFEDSDEKLMHLIDDPLVVGTIRDRMNMYIGWLNFSNVIPISYEEIVGANGGGSDIEQTKTIWSLQLKLHIPGNPVELAKTLYNEESPTFNTGQIGRHKKLFKKIHYDRFKALPQDFMEKMGYGINAPGMPKYTEYYRKRSLEYWQPTEKELWLQRLVKENYMGYNIISTAGQFVALPVEIGTVDLSKESDRKKEGVYLGFESLEETIHYISSKQNKTFIEHENFKGYNKHLIHVIKPLVIWLTGLPCAEKTTIARALEKEFLTKGSILEVLDEEILRRGVFNDSGFSEEDRDIHNFRVANKAFEIVKKGVPVCVSLVSPYSDTRRKIKEMINNYIEVWIKYPIEVCIKRDTKGMYRSAGEGRIKNFTGVDIPYEEPSNADIIVETDKMSAEFSVATIIDKLEELGFIIQKGISIPKLLGSYQNFNLIRYKDRIYAVLQGINLDLLKIKKSKLKEYQDENRLFIANSIDEAKNLIEHK